MKKFIFIMMLIMTSAFAESYSIRCYKCKEYAESHKYVSSCSGCNAWRSFKDENDKNKGYLIYKCEHGHILYIDVKTGERK